MKAALVQANLHWENREKNLAHLRALITSQKEDADLYILPEMFSTGFTMSPETQAEEAAGESLLWMKNLAREKQAIFCGSVAVHENHSYFNRFYWVTPGGTVSHYDKRHLFRMGKENQHYAAGTKRLVERCVDLKVCAQVCYDLRFPVWSRNKLVKGADGVRRHDYDVLVYVANWPTVRIYAWRQLLIARAIENQCYVIGVNRIGQDGNGLDHPGCSMVVGPLGDIQAEAELNNEQVLFYSTHPDALFSYRQRFPAALDADDFTMNP